MTNKLQDYEKRLFNYRLELDKLIRIQNSSTNKSKFIEMKIDFLKQELAYIDGQLDLLKANLYPNTVSMNTSEPVQDSPFPKNIETTDADNNIEQQKPYIPYYASMGTTTNTEAENTTAQNRIETISNTQDKQYANQLFNTNKATNKKDFENIFGKNLMGIFASLLIFISFIVFAAVILPNLTNGIKLFAMYSISFGFLGLGLYLQKKDASNKLFMSISGCGVGAIYISILLSNIYFNVIGDITMYILIFFWAMFVCHLSCTKSYIFQIIGQIGITISILFGSILCATTDDWTKMTFLVIFFITTQSIFLISHFEDEFKDNIVNIIGSIICLFILIVALPGYIDDKDYIIMINISRILMIMYSICQLGLGYFKYTISEKSHPLYTFSNISNFLLITFLLDFDAAPILLIVLSIISLVLIEYRLKNNNFRIIQGFYSLALIVCMYQIQSLDNFEFIMEYASFALLAVPFALYGFYSNDKYYKIFSMIYFVLFVFDFNMDDASALILGTGIICMYAYLLKEKAYSTNVKNYLYIMSLFFILINAISITDNLDMGYDLGNLFTLALVAIAHTLAVKSPFGKNWNTGMAEESFGAISGFANIFLMCSSISLIDSIEEPGLHFITILIALTLFLINSKNLLDRPGIGWGLYVGIKSTFLMIYIMGSFNAPDFAISICCLLFAIASIGMGFVFKYKSLRVYGLGLSLLSIAKLILVDMSYENSLSRALSYFVCGILCFVISLIYNYVDKKLQD